MTSLDPKDLLTQMQQDSGSTAQDNMGKIGAVANDVADTDKEIADLEEQLKKKKDYKKHLAENVLPNLFAEVGLSELKLADGRHLKVTNYYGASIKDAKKEAAFEWLRNNGFGDLIKNQVSCSFGRNEDEKAKSLIDTLNDQGYQSMQREWVEPSTLRAFIREQHEAGKELPMDLLGAFVVAISHLQDSQDSLIRLLSREPPGSPKGFLLRQP